MTNEATTVPVPPVKPRGAAWRGVALAAIIFISGGLTGWGIEHFLEVRGDDRLPTAPDPPVHQVINRLREELLLDDDQAKALTDVYRKRYNALKAVRDEMRPRFQTEYDGLHQDVQKILTPAQFKRWDERFSAVKNRMMPPPPRREGPPPPGPENDGPPTWRPPPPPRGDMPNGPPPGFGGPRDGPP